MCDLGFRVQPLWFRVKINLLTKHTGNYRLLRTYFLPLDCLPLICLQVAGLCFLWIEMCIARQDTGPRFQTCILEDAILDGVEAAALNPKP